jgi:hypothetical protein
LSFSIMNPKRPSKLMEDLREVEDKLMFEHRKADDNRRKELDKQLHAVHIAKTVAQLRWLLED